MKPSTHYYRCETCQKKATVHIAAIGCHFCASCLKKIDACLRKMKTKTTKHLET